MDCCGSTKNTKHARKRPKNHEVSEQNKYWKAVKFTIDIKMVRTIPKQWVNWLSVFKTKRTLMID